MEKFGLKAFWNLTQAIFFILKQTQNLSYPQDQDKNLDLFS